MKKVTLVVRILSALIFFGVLWFSASNAAAEDLEEVRRMAEHGSRPFQLRLWEIYSRGEGVARDEHQAMWWLTTAAEGGYGPAQNLLGAYLLDHARYRSDIERARQWLEKAAANRQAEAQYRLGRLYLEGASGLVSDINQALHWFKIAADAGYAPALYALGWVYEQGRGVEADGEKAFAFFSAAARRNHSGAMHQVGRILLEQNGPHAAVQASEWFQRAADSGEADALNDLAVLFLRQQGRIGERTASRDLILEWLRQAAKAGSDMALYNLWRLYVRSVITPSNEKELVQWLHTAARRGEGRAQRQMGNLWRECAVFPQHVSEYGCRRMADYWLALGGKNLPLQVEPPPEWGGLTAPGAEGEDGVSQPLAEDSVVFSFSMNNSLE
jgi:TPR repeat protein